jgi:hypothetical protein
VSFLRGARQDLVAIYDSLNVPEKADRFRAEFDDPGIPAAPQARSKDPFP